jgi:pSer/pThr/pTyr-binding forkhead associated (FHA) protein
VPNREVIVRIQTSANRPARIVALQEGIQPVQYQLGSDICVIGRADICQIVIPNKIVSRIQAVVEQDQHGDYVLRDNNSANGTYVNGHRLRESYVLRDRDEIGLGAAAALLRFEAVVPTIPSNEAEATVP